MFEQWQPNRFIVDISHHNGWINFDEARQHVGLFIARTGDGHRYNTNGEFQGVKDRKYSSFVEQMKSKGIPFGNYMFNRFSGVTSARQEAETFWEIGDKAATLWVCDAEVSTAPNMLECIQAFVDRLRELGAPKIGLYIGHHKYLEFGGSQVHNIDFTWIPRYGKRPSFECDLWQFTETGQVPGIGKCDINILQGSKGMDFYTSSGGSSRVEHSSEHPISLPDREPEGYLTVTVDVANIRTEPNKGATIARKTTKGEGHSYYGWSYQDGHFWYEVSEGQWISDEVCRINKDGKSRGAVWVNASNVNLREGASTGDKVVGQISFTAVDVHYRYEDWIYVNNSEVGGWMYFADYVHWIR